MMVWKLNLGYLYANVSLPLLHSKKKEKKKCMNYAEMQSPYDVVLVTGNIKCLIMDI